MARLGRGGADADSSALPHRLTPTAFPGFQTRPERSIRSFGIAPARPKPRHRPDHRRPTRANDREAFDSLEDRRQAAEED